MQEKPLSASALKSLSHSPELCWSRHLDPNRAVKKDTPATLRGKLIHELVLLTKRRRTYTAMPKGMARRGAEYKALSAEVGASNLVKHDEMEEARTIARNIRSNWEAFYLLYGDYGSCMSEHRYEWHTPGNVWMVAIMDHLNAASKRVVDIKTIQSMDMLEKSAMDGRWDIQECVYREAAASLWDIPERRVNVRFIVAETTAPFRVRCITLDPQLVEHGKEAVKSLRRQYMHRLEANDWSGPDSLDNITFPRYYWSKQDAC